TSLDCDWSSDVCSSDLEVKRLIEHLEPVNVPEPGLTGFTRKTKYPGSQHHNGWQVDHADKPWAFYQKLARFRKGEGKVQKQRSLEQTSSHVGPEDDRIKSVELAGIVERV